MSEIIHIRTEKENFRLTAYWCCSGFLEIYELTISDTKYQYDDILQFIVCITLKIIYEIWVPFDLLKRDKLNDVKSFNIGRIFHIIELIKHFYMF